jgi:predicted flavoprotein YhiN
MTTLTIDDMIRSGHNVSEFTKERFEKIEKELMQEPCENCGVPTKEVGQLFPKDDKDEQGRPIVKMLCAKCISGKSGKKKARK